MAERPAQQSQRYILTHVHLDVLLHALSDDGYEVIGPTIQQGAVVYDRVHSVEELPVGWTDVHDGGTYRLQRRPDQAVFGYAVGPDGLKQYLFPSNLLLWQAERQNGSFTIGRETPEPPKYAFIGVRSCELHALAMQDKVFLEGPYPDPAYQSRRSSAFIVAVNCTQAGGTCFCASMDTGPQARSGFDLALTEVVDGAYSVVEVASERGAALLAKLPHREAKAEEVDAAAKQVAAAADSMGRALDTTGIKDLLHDNPEHPRWDEVAERCLTCGNCTMVCPTCFCHAVIDVSDLGGQKAQRWRRWDTCFSIEFSHVHGGSVRESAKSRYRQWLTHKLASWIEQFGTSGCVGCGRCITWCPVGIDLTEEVAAIRTAQPQPSPAKSEEGAR